MKKKYQLRYNGTWKLIDVSWDMNCPGYTKEQIINMASFFARSGHPKELYSLLERLSCDSLDQSDILGPEWKERI